MNVTTLKPFQIVYSIYHHELLGYLLDSFVVQKNHNGKLTLQNQNVSAANAADFASGLDDNDFEIIKLTDAITQDHIARKRMKIWEKAGVLENTENRKGSNGCAKNVGASYL